MSWTSPETYIGLISALAAVIAAWHAAKANGKSTTINANVNSRLEDLLNILKAADITIPHDVAAKVVSAPPHHTRDDATIEEQVAAEFFAKLGGKIR